ncbi:PPE domain-containing protein [Actinokineospora cianjurensis]|uniref:PPE-repeat protein n=1 Tax=Actinokineospora cianjurensis TaxID=585224 RepID=A0A421B6E4_9PSEU|nr:PPE domain-containing protein [Actinokineospora cianjurensis]RLK59790.1 PPE-repeat protein [Actinokineospora cianjurensis]
MTAISGEGIYDNFHAGVGTESLISAAELLAKVAVEYETLAVEILAINASMAQAWQGEASESAQRGAVPLARWHAAAQPALTQAKEVTMNQVSLFHSARDAVQPVPPAPARPNMWDNLTTLGAASESYEDSVRQRNLAAEANIHVMRVYETQSAAHIASLPQTYGEFTIDPVEQAPQAEKPVVPPVRQPIPARRPAVEPPDNGRARSAVEQTGRPQVTATSWATPPQQVVGSQPVPQPGPRPAPTPGPAPGPPVPPLRPPGTRWTPGRTPVGQWGQPGGQGSTGERAPQATGRPGGGQPGQAGGRPGGESGPRVPHGGEQGRVRAEVGRGFGPEGARTGVGPTEGARGFGAGGSRTGRSMGGGLPVGAGGGAAKGEDDLERSAPSYLVVADPEELFGTDAITAPPVIGE